MNASVTARRQALVWGGVAGGGGVTLWGGQGVGAQVRLARRAGVYIVRRRSVLLRQQLSACAVYTVDVCVCVRERVADEGAGAQRDAGEMLQQHLVELRRSADAVFEADK